MTIERITTGVLYENCYLVSAEGRTDAVAIDPGDDYERIVAAAERKKLTVKAILLTHAHFDHCNAAKAFADGGAEIYMHSAELELVNTDKNMASELGARFNRFVPDVLLVGGEKITVCGLTFEVIHTPGHTVGGVCYVCEKNIFSGDTLFYLSVGRSDFPTGSGSALADSVRNKLFALEGDYRVYPGHGDVTTLNFERENNPYV